MDRVGIMLDWAIMQSGIDGKKSYEHLPYYAEIGKEMGLEPVFFHPRHVRSNGKVKGYFWNGKRLVPRIVPIPRVIHNRVLTGDQQSRKVIRQLSKKQIVFNGLVVRDKWRVHQMLWKNPKIRSYLPHTVKYSGEKIRDFLNRYSILYVKPAVGSVGIGVVRIEREGDHYHFISSKQRKVLTRQRLLSELAEWTGKRRFLIQQGVPLNRYQGRTYDIRVSVQKNREMKWTVSGMVAKVANPQNKLSNLSRGGKAVPLKSVWQDIFSQEQQEQIVESIQKAALDLARQYAKNYPSLADLGMDMGIDDKGKPYLIEINVRDQRYSFYKAKEMTMFKRTYRHPMEYARSLLKGMVPTIREIHHENIQESPIILADLL
ncbi:YheC/YheD family protein [Brevibacillus ruminantium]|uniref:YheC/YheD family protein n=1 Tax=Brevibacillus ruminantium TaxID=2950604 RepID=A0ABY4WPL7_9BACL|nr:YheC/YheD family protein [Brevibacillus ruminantium]USG68027.1 YheC/YheD family protein [Brevibacillus ruminantium]